MTASPETIVARFDALCLQVMNSVRNASADTSAYDMESLIFTNVLALGRLLVEAFFAAQAPKYHFATARDRQGRELSYVGERSGLFYSAFGEVSFKRSYYSGGGSGFFPLDASLNLPPTGASDFLRVMREDLALEMSFERASSHVARYFPVPTSTRAVQDAVRTDSLDIGAYYAQAPAPPPIEEATVLVVQADGKGIPMVRSELSASSVKQASENLRQPGRPKGPNRREGKMKEATVISVAAHHPFVRTPEQVVACLFREPDPKIDSRSPAVQKRVWATLTGKASAIKQAKMWADQMDADHITDYVTLTDGLPSLQRCVDETFPQYTRVLDLMHAMGYLWNAADVRFGNSTACKEWVRDALLRILRGQVVAVIDEIDQWQAETKSAGTLTLKTTVMYFRKNQAAMAYDLYLARGWPIATGMIEGTCKHIVKDRCEKAGMRWTNQTAEAILRLRCVKDNGDWDAYHKFRMNRRHRDYYGNDSSNTYQLAA